MLTKCAGCGGDTYDTENDFCSSCGYVIPLYDVRMMGSITNHETESVGD